MAARRILFVDAYRLTAFVRRGKAVADEGQFTRDDAGRKAFAAYLARHRDSLFYLLVEIAEEGFHAEDIPFLSGRDRAAVVARKLDQHFYGTPLAVALTQGRREEGRRDERVLFAALTRPQSLEPWMETLKQAKAALAGVLSLPQTVALLAAAPAMEHKHLLLATLTCGGLRQTYFAAGQLRFSRLTTSLAGTAEEAVKACAAEAAKIYQYLAGQRLLDRGTPLSVLVLAHPAQADLFQRQCVDTDELHFEIIDLVATARHHGLSTPPPDSHSETLFAHLVLRQTPRLQFAPADALRSFQFRRIRQALHGAGLAALIGCLLFAGKQLLDAGNLAEGTQLLRLETARDMLKYDAARQALPQTPVSTEKLRLLVDRYETLLQTSPGPAPLYHRLSNAIGRFPQIELNRLNWSIVDRIDDAFTEPGKANAIPARPQRAQTFGAFAIVDVYATLPMSLADDPRGQIDVIDGFTAQLRANADIQVQALSLPFDTASGRVLRSGNDSASAPQFTLRVVQKLRP